MKRLLLFFCLLPGVLFAHTEQHRDYADEIDQALHRYVEGIRRSGSVDIDEEKISRIFGRSGDENEDELILEEEADAEQTAFANAGSRVHVVQKGETLFAIARKYGVVPTDLIKWNPFLNGRPLYIGDRLTLKTPPSLQRPSSRKSVKKPGSGSSNKINGWKRKKVVKYRVKKYRVKKGDSLSAIARKHKKSLSEILKLNKMKKTDIIHPNQVLLIEKVKITKDYRYRKLFVQPVKGRLSSGFGSRRNPFAPGRYHFHKGIDLAAPIGTPFHAARDGLVMFSGRMRGYGNVIFIRHKGGYITVYGHNKVNLVKNGDIVRQGQVIGKIGRTGIATGPHLHFEVRKMDEIINPFVALKMQEVIPVSSKTAYR